MQNKHEGNDFISSGTRRGYSTFKLKCSFCHKNFYFEFVLKKSIDIFCSNCKRKAYRLIYHNGNSITIRRYFSKGKNIRFEDLMFGKKRIKKYSKRQHEIPKMYLKNFCMENSKKIWVYNKKKALIEDRNIQTFSRKLFLYDKVQPQTIELMLESIEEDMSHYLPNIIKSNKIFQSKENFKQKQEKKELFIRFIISMHLRRKIMKKLIFENIIHFEAVEGKKISIFGIKFDGIYSKPDNNGIKIYNDLVQETHRNIIRSSVSQEKLYKDYTIHLLINRTKTPFITSDNPLFRQGKVQFKDIFIPSRIFLPISPYHCVLLSHPKEKQFSSEILAKENFINKMNHWQYIKSNKYIISNQKDIVNFFGKFNDLEEIYPEIPLCAFIFISNTTNKKYQFLI